MSGESRLVFPPLDVFPAAVVGRADCAVTALDDGAAGLGPVGAPVGVTVGVFLDDERCVRVRGEYDVFVAPEGDCPSRTQGDAGELGPEFAGVEPVGCLGGCGEGDGGGGEEGEGFGGGEVEGCLGEERGGEEGFGEGEHVWGGIDRVGGGEGRGEVREDGAGAGAEVEVGGCGGGVVVA